jgi:hypothetical protein
MFLVSFKFQVACHHLFAGMSFFAPICKRSRSRKYPYLRPFAALMWLCGERPQLIQKKSISISRLQILQKNPFDAKMKAKFLNAVGLSNKITRPLSLPLSEDRKLQGATVVEAGVEAMWRRGKNSAAASREKNRSKARKK